MLLEGQDRIVIVCRIVVKERKPAGSSSHRDVRSVINCAVSPAPLGSILFFTVLGVVDYEISVFQKLDVSLVTRMLKYRTRIIPVRLMIRHISNGGSAVADSVSDSGRRMIEILSFDKNVTDAE